MPKRDAPMNSYLRKLATVLAIIISTATIMALAGEHRWWVWRSEFQALAADSYGSDIAAYHDKLLSTQLAIETCRNDERCKKAFLLKLIEGHDILEQKIDELEQKRNDASGRSTNQFKSRQVR